MKQSLPTHIPAQRECLIILLLLLLSRNVEPNPGADLNVLSTSCDFKPRFGPGIIHLNVRSLYLELDRVKIWQNHWYWHSCAIWNRLNKSITKTLELGVTSFAITIPEKKVVLLSKLKINFMPLSSVSIIHWAISIACIQTRTTRGLFYWCCSLL